MRKKQNLIGYVVCGVGVLALIVVVALAMMRRPGQTLTGQTIATQLEGDWQSDFSGYHAVFQTHSGTYQILAIRNQAGGEHYYSRGHVTARDNLLTMTPDPAMGAPQSDDAFVTYKDLTSGAYTVTLRQEGNTLIWSSGPPDPERSGFNPTHPLLQYSGADSIIWTPR